MDVAVFDLDNTLLAGDSDYLWGRFLIKNGILDAATHQAENQRFYRAYLDGSLDIAAYTRFALSAVIGMPAPEREALRQRYIDQAIKRLVAPKAPALLERHRAQGDLLVITTATNRFIVEPIARLLGVEHLIATDPQIRDGLLTGEIEGVPNFQQGKVVRLQAWLERHAGGRSAARLTCYSDSHNDLPLLRMAETAVAVDPDDTLRAEAERCGWQVISLR